MKKIHNELKIVIICLVVIAIGLLILGYDSFIDGTIISPAETVKMPAYKLAYDSSYFSPNPMGTVSGVYAVQTDKDSYAPGEAVYVRLTLCRYRNVPTTVRWTYTNDILASTLPREGQISETGCYIDEKVLIGTVPDELSNAYVGSRYNLHGTVNLKVNPFRTVSYLLISNFFTIKK